MPRPGRYKRHWGAYGSKEPSDDKLPAYAAGWPSPTLSKSFSNPVHCVRLSRDGLVYVCDRANDRIQVFQKDGTFVKEFQVEPPDPAERLGMGPGAVGGQRPALHLCRRRRQHGRSAPSSARRGQTLARFGRPGRMAGEFKWVHNMAIDSKGNLYTTEVGTGRRVQKFSAPARRPASPSRALAGSQRASCGPWPSGRARPRVLARAADVEQALHATGRKGNEISPARGPFKAPASCAISRLGRWSCARAKLRIFACHCASVPA